VFLIGGASRSSASGAPIDDGIFMSSIQTMRHLKPSEFPLAQPYRLKVVTATTTSIDDYVKRMPDDRFKKEQFELLNGLYPKRLPKAGDALKVVE
jgi:predicted Zn-dependent protease